MKLFKHFSKHKLLLVRSFKAIAGNILKLFLLDKILSLVPSRYRMLCKVLIMFGYKFTLFSTIFGVIYSILAEVFNWTFNYKTIIDLILGLVLSYETGLFSELKFILSYYYTKFFDWWISKIETTDKEKATNLRKRIFSPSEPIDIPPLDPKEKARMEKEYLDRLSKLSKERNENWHERMERQIREMKDRNININITPDYNKSNSWISYNTLKWLMYALVSAGILYSYYHFLNEVNSFLHTQFITLYNSAKDVFTHPGTYLASIGSYLWLNTKNIVKNYIFRKVWPLSWFFKPKTFTKDEIDDKINDPWNQQGEDNFPSTSMRDLIHTDMPDMESTQENEGKIEPKYDSSKYKEEMDKVVAEQGKISKRWNETDEEYIERKHRIDAGKAKVADIGSPSETMSEAKDRLFESSSVEDDIEVAEDTPQSTYKNKFNLEEVAQMSEEQFMDKYVQPRLDHYIERNKDNNDPRIQAFIKWVNGVASLKDIELVIDRSLPSKITEKAIRKHFINAVLDITQTLSHEKVIDLYAKTRGK